VSCVSHVVSDSGCSIPCCVLFAFLLCLVCPMLSVTLDAPFRVVYCLAGTHKTQEEGKQYTTRNGTSRVTDNMGHTRHRRKANNTQHNTENYKRCVLCIVCLPPVSCVSHVVSNSGCAIPCCVLFGLLLCLVCPMLSVILDVPFRTIKISNTDSTNKSGDEHMCSRRVSSFCLLKKHSPR
jgi:hypothetical protein